MIVVSFAISDGDIMFNSEISNKITLSKKKSNESIEIDQRRVQIRKNENGLMGVSYLAPVFEIMDLENFFDGVIASENLGMDIWGTGEFTVSFRGLVDGRGKDLPQNLDHKIILLQEPKCLDPRENIQIAGFSKFKIKGKISE